MINIDESTTELVADRPTPAVPPLVRIPWKQETKPMIKPNIAVLKVGGRKSLSVAFFRPLCRKRRNVMGSRQGGGNPSQKDAGRVRRERQ